MLGSKIITSRIKHHEEAVQMQHDAERQATYDGNPQAAEHLSRANKYRLGRTALIIGAIGVAGFFGKQMLDDFGDQFKGAVPHDDIQGKIESQLKRVTLPNRAILVEGTGTGTAHINVRTESKIPVLGSIFNHTVATLTDRNAYAKREGNVQIVSDRNAISLQAIHTPITPNTKPVWHIRADVDAKKLSTATANMRYAVENGKQQLSSDSDILAFATEKGVTKRTGWVTDWADRSFQDACGRALTGDVSAGVARFVRDQVNGTANLLETPGHRQDANLLRMLARRPISVTFYEMDRSVDGSLKPRAVDAESVSLARTFVPSGAAIAHLLGKSASDVHLETGAQDCSFTSAAMRQQMQIQGIPEQNPGI